MGQPVKAMDGPWPSHCRDGLQNAKSIVIEYRKPKLWMHAQNEQKTQVVAALLDNYAAIER